MTKQIKVDVDKSLVYQANGRLKPADEQETARLKIKKFICPNCHLEEEATKAEFGEVRLCHECDTVMLQQL